jgi:hypothetical protein
MVGALLRNCGPAAGRRNASHPGSGKIAAAGENRQFCAGGDPTGSCLIIYLLELLQPFLSRTAAAL